MEENTVKIDYSEEAYLERVRLSSERIAEFPGALRGAEADYFLRIKSIAALCLSEEMASRHDREMNEALFAELTEEGYKTSFLNTEYAAARLGSLGVLLSAWYLEFRGIIAFTYEKRMKDVAVLLETSIQLFAAFEESKYSDSFTAEIKDIIYSYIYDYAEEFTADELRRNSDPALSFARDIVMNADLNDIGDHSYLYAYGEWITDEERLTARLMSELSEAAVEKMAKVYTDGYIKGFAMTGKSLAGKSTVSCYLPIGFERFMRAAVRQFEAAGLDVVINRNPVHLINKKSSANIKPGFYGASNSQCDYDHKEDLALFWGDKLKALRLEACRHASEEHAALLKKHSGHACVEIFGRKGSAPVTKAVNAAYSEHQLKVMREYTFKAHEIMQQYMPDEETSFTIIAWPTPSIAGDITEADTACPAHAENAAAGHSTVGEASAMDTVKRPYTAQRTDAVQRQDTVQKSDAVQRADAAQGSVTAKGHDRQDTQPGISTADDGKWSMTRYREIFDRFIDINTLPEDRWRMIQQALIDALDKADHVVVKGSTGNATDIRVQLHKLKEPESETNFENCLADVNIPAGEVFTSPVLKGTEGILHAGFVYIGGYLFKDLKISFHDGRVSDYSCANYEDAEAGRELIKRVIFKNREELPMGEFAIGTNTIAYAAALSYGIADRMPVLIAEKTGPHFAVGDTCYSYEEDITTFNPDGKRITARENECSALRNTEPEKAYFSVHTDITLPYSELGRLSAVCPDGSHITIISDGRFVLQGTEELNAALNAIK